MKDSVQEVYGKNGLMIKVNGKVIHGYAKNTPLVNNPMQPTFVAFCVSQAIYRARLEAEQDRKLIRGYSK